MSRIRLLVIAVGCLVAGPVLVIRYFAGLPSLDRLEKVTGIAQLDVETRRARYPTAQHPVLIVEGRRYKYLDWFPQADRIASMVRVGDPIVIWTDRGNNDWVWQIEQGNQVVMPYAEVRNAVASNKRFDWVIGGGAFAIGLVASVRLYRQKAGAA